MSLRTQQEDQHFPKQHRFGKSASAAFFTSTYLLEEHDAFSDRKSVPYVEVYGSTAKIMRHAAVEQATLTRCPLPELIIDGWATHAFSLDFDDWLQRCEDREVAAEALRIKLRPKIAAIIN